MTTDDGSLKITEETDIVTARTTIRDVVTELGFSMTDTTRIVTAVSELARNVYLYAGTGTMSWHTSLDDNRRYIEIVFDDDGPGITDVDEALSEGYSTSEGMGQGLPGTQKLMDEFDIETNTQDGTAVTIRKHLP
jgi:serine/threonine-protein kinase RsbT